VEYGKLTQIGGELAYQSLEKATDDLMEGQVDVLVTGPISKENIQSDNFHFAGHTEYLTEKFGATGSLMLMVCDNLRVGLVTNHLPLNIIADTISVDRILSKIKLLHQSLLVDFGIPSPKIAVLSLNPHAGDGGLMGTEEAKIIIPAIQKAYAEGIHAFGPYPSDGFFGTGNYAKFDGILAMYHDQGLIPFKVLSQGRGVNFTAGLPFVRTSPAHGTAFDLAGKDQAGFESMQQAILLAVKIFKNRIEWEEMTRNPLKIQEPLAQDFE
ncbi:MAG TPA: 4-hydroxythreonine-4-phosphate dehydrogenase PdxA, partial [Bacteroidales bacterium]|nr:4-hydroxythreonine-4-phosphate dehydrogenase PdxA [Bacteroidales bacterium]